MNPKNKTILIIGGTGFLGRNIAISLLEVHYNLVILTRNKKCAETIFSNQKDIQFIEGSLTDIDKLKQIIDQINIDLVIHLASSLIPNSNREEFFKDLKKIILPTFDLLEALAHKKIKIMFFSSAGTIYGNHEGLITEKTRLKPINHYGFSKLFIEQYILMLSRIAELPYIILRPSNIYGKSYATNNQQGFIEVAIEKMEKGEHIEIWGSGNQKRDFLHVTDICNIVSKIISLNITNETINIAYGKSYSLLEIIEILEKNLGIKASLVFSNGRKVDAKNVRIDISYLKSIINYKPVEIKQGIEIYLSRLKK